MKLPSINFLLQNSIQSFLRFPLTIVSACIAVVTSIYLIEEGDNLSNRFPYINLLLTGSIGIPLFFCITILTNITNTTKRSLITLQALSILLLLGIYLTFPQMDSTHNIDLPYIKYGIYNALCHLCVAYIPFLFNKNLNGFWNYNKLLFIRFLTSNLFAGVIYVGLAFALLALHELFAIRIHKELYIEIFIVCAFLFNTWFFISGIPEDFKPLDSNNEYPKGLKIFAQYILLSLLVIYLVILYAYAAKIVIVWDWPKGIFSYLIIAVSVLGTFTFLLLYPYGNSKENNWINIATKGYYYLLIPLIVLLFVALSFRISDYGITLKRYVLFILGIWLLIVAVYSIFNKNNIKFIPISLSVIMLLTSFGPWGMFQFSERNQVNRLKSILIKNKILDENNIVINEAKYTVDSSGHLLTENKLQNQNKLNDSLSNEVYSILNYLDQYHGFEEIQSWYSQDINQVASDLEKYKSSRYRCDEVELYMNALGLEHKYFYSTSKYFNYNVSDSYKNVIEVKNYDYAFEFNYYEYDNTPNSNKVLKSLLIKDTPHELLLLNDSTVQLKKENLLLSTFNLQPMLNALDQKYGVGNFNHLSQNELQIDINTNQHFRLILTSLSLEKVNNLKRIQSIDGYLLMKIDK